MQQDAIRLFTSANYRKLFIGQLVSGLGDWLATFAFMALVFALTGNATDVAFILILRLIPPIFTAPMGGVLADRMPRKTIMITADLVRTILILLVPFVNLGLLYVLAFLHECASLFFLPARDALIPQLIPEESLETGNGLIMAASNGMLPVAGALFSLLEGLGGVYPAFLPFASRINSHPEAFAFFIDAATFVFSAVLLFGMHVEVDNRRIARHRKRHFLGDLKRGFTIVWRNPELRRLACGISVAMLGGGVLFAVGVGYVRQSLHQSSTAFGWLIALWGVGMALGLLSVRSLAHRRGRMYIFTVAISILGVILATMALLPIPLLAFALAVPFGAAFATAFILATTLAQELSDKDTRGTTMGGFQALFNLGLGVGAIVFGWLASHIDHLALGGMVLDGNQSAMLIGGLLICCGAGTVMLLDGHRSLSHPWALLRSLHMPYH